MEFELIVSMLSWFAGSFVGGLCGLGAAIISQPPMLLVMPVQKVVLVSCLAALWLGIATIICYHKSCPWQTVKWLTIGVLPGSYFGILALKYFPEAVLEIGLGSMLIFCTAGLQLLQNRLSIEDRPRNAILTGFIAGIIGTSINTDGPIVAFYALLIGMPPIQFIAFTSGYFLLRCIISDAAQAVSGLYTEEILYYALWCAPASVAGFLLSIPLVRRIKVETFRGVVKGIILLAGVMCLGRGIWTL